MNHTVTLSVVGECYIAKCSCGFPVDCTTQRLRDAQVENHLAMLTGFRPLLCYLCSIQVASVKEPSVRIDRACCAACQKRVEPHHGEIVNEVS